MINVEWLAAGVLLISSGKGWSMQIIKYTGVEIAMGIKGLLNVPIRRRLI
jgi:hypothetical protein